jgi:hypothetical protein
MWNTLSIFLSWGSQNYIAIAVIMAMALSGTVLTPSQCIFRVISYKSSKVFNDVIAVNHQYFHFYQSKFNTYSRIFTIKRPANLHKKQ